ncbi:MULTISPECIES: PadR family transcriptional regulator [Gordonia]|uniref:PadR family transcriptional regulator n=1 Tax=Gordonia amicalis TaxID=89053 RepID=A0AAE4U412_9ACTN|nr:MULTISPECIES: PadR family transcriptional regulator [Gordonia]ATD70410.1 PadR family transcriptional regulator [Gordonia sp. 1D]MBA5847124.1 PadR family transcriptional regulator [Gordonia amicalis]MDV6310755.1 PadR family transcriptional regulator [Gordonia amicalis]MDV7101720.1 PadR family transcriptional regulator [Gordonia amicalis]MDV7175119.1 PadR family transcriptional regulator [Gordonia amicalis]
MACSTPLGPVAILVLGLLLERPMHPYEMVQTTVARREDRLAKFRAGTLYHAVDRLATNELIEVHEIRREGNRPERTVYAITEQGRRALTENLERILETRPEEYPELYLALSEAHGLPRNRVVELLERRVATMRADLADVEVAVAEIRSRGKPEMFFLDEGCRIATLTAQIAWLDDLVDRLRTHRIAWLDDPDSPYRVPTGPNSSPAPNPCTVPDSSPDTERLTQKVE